MSITPRPYQIETVKAVKSAREEGITRQLVSLPTGCGKTICFGMLAKELNAPTLILAHREELLGQAVAKIRLVMPGVDIGILRAEETEGLRAQVCVASVQTAMQDRRLDALKERGFSLCVVDEAHHSTADSYVKIIGGLGFMSGDPDKLLVGVTATAYRGDNVALGAVFEKIVYERSILTMIRAGYLCDAKGISVSTQADLSDVHTRGGDFALNELSDVIDIPARNRLIAESYREHTSGRRGVVFCCDVKHSMSVAEAFRAQGIYAQAVYGDMDRDERRRVLAAYDAGEIPVLTNCNVLTEGWDSPETSAIMLARPTKSAVLYTQAVGRGLRTAPGKDMCLVVDFVDIAGRHKLCGLSTLDGEGKISPKKGESILEAVERVEFEMREIDRQAKLMPRTAEFELFERSRFVWVPVGNHHKLNMTDGSTVWAKQIEGGYLPLVFGGDGTVVNLSDDALPLGYATGVCEDYVRQYGSAFAAKDAPWRKNRASEEQLKLLTKLGVEWAGNLTKGEASMMIDKALSQGPSSKQLYYINKFRLHPDPSLLTSREASRLIGQHKKMMEAEGF